MTTGGFCGCREGPAPAFEVTSALLIAVVLVNRLATVASIDRVGKGRPAVDRETAEDHAITKGSPKAKSEDRKSILLFIPLGSGSDSC